MTEKEERLYIKTVCPKAVSGNHQWIPQSLDKTKLTFDGRERPDFCNWCGIYRDSDNYL